MQGGETVANLLSESDFARSGVGNLDVIMQRIDVSYK